MKYVLYGNAKTDKIIGKTFKAQLRMINAIKKRKRLGGVALEILYTAAYCEMLDIPLMVFSPIFNERYDNPSKSQGELKDLFEDLLLSSLDLLVRYQLVDAYRKRPFIQMNSIHQLTQSNIQLMLKEEGKEEGKEEEIINRAMFFFEESLDGSKCIIDNEEEEAPFVKPFIRHICRNAESVYSHAYQYEKLREGQRRKSIKSLLEHFYQQKFYTPSYTFVEASL